MATMRLALPFTLVIISFIVSAYGETHSVNILTSHGGKKTQLRTVTTSSCEVSIKLSHGAKFVASDQSCSIVSSSSTVSCTGKAKIRGHKGKKKHSQKVSQLSHYGDGNSKICSSAFWIKPQSTRKQVTCKLNTCPTKQNAAKITTPAEQTTASPPGAQAKLAGTLYFPDLTLASVTPSLTSSLCGALKSVTETQGASAGVVVSNCTVDYQSGSLIANYEFAISCRSSTADMFGIALNAITEDTNRSSSSSQLLSAVGAATGQAVTRVEAREIRCQHGCDKVYNSTTACTLPDCKTCVTTSGQTQCYLCNDGRQPVGYSCLVTTQPAAQTTTVMPPACSESCQTCASDIICTDCISYDYDLSDSNYFLDGNGNCTACGANCLSCNSSYCISCNYGFGLDNDNWNCKACGANCSDCNSTTCVYCNIGFRQNIYNWACTARCVDTNCDSCGSDGACSSCATGYNLNDNRTCSPCGTNCSSCNATACVQCKQGLLPDSGGWSCIVKCPENCDACDEDGVCTDCHNAYPGEQNYFLNSDGVCSPCAQHCLQCDSTSCIFCDDGFIQATNNWMCTACPVGCSSCTRCTQCLDGYSMYRGLCIDSEGCSASTRPLLLTDSGTFTTQNYPYNYPINANCQWLLQSTTPDEVVKLDFTAFRTESEYDFVKIYDGSNSTSLLMATLTGIYSVAPQGFTSTQNYMLITFTSDESVTYRGFNATFSSTAAAAPP